ncbi:MAG: hypothetical protein AB4063_09355 [Crocosphaera sp.]
MNESQAITIQLPKEEGKRLQAEAKRLDVSVEALATMMLCQNITQLKPTRTISEVLFRLRELTKDMAQVDPVKLGRLCREELENRGIF